MKNLFTILAIAAVSSSAFAQTHSLSVAFTSYENEEVISNPVDFSYTITNRGHMPIRQGDSIVVGYALDGALFIVENSQFFWDTHFIVTLQADFEPGAVMSIPGFSMNLTSVDSITEINLCAFALHYAVGLDMGNQLTYPLADSSPLDNFSCVEVTLPVGMKESLKTLTNKIYVSNRELVLDNADYNFKELAAISIMDLTGKTVRKTSVALNGRNTISLANFTTGVYFVRVVVGTNVATTKVFVK